MDPGAAIGSWGAFEENEFGLALTLSERLLKELLLFPSGEHFVFEIVGRSIGGKPTEAAALLSRRTPRRGRHGADSGHSRFGPEELEPAPLRVLATTWESEASTSD